jgi:hypothetical protein
VAGLSADGDVAVLEQADSGLNVYGGDAQHHIAPLALGHDGFDLLGKGLGLGQGVVHLPVAGDDGLAVAAIHNKSLLSYIVCGPPRSRGIRA